jgi:hypothetical protein
MPNVAKALKNIEQFLKITVQVNSKTHIEDIGDTLKLVIERINLENKDEISK